MTDDLRCPRCGGGVEWGEGTGKPGRRGSARCFMSDLHIRADLRNDCDWRGQVVRLDNGDVAILAGGGR